MNRILLVDDEAEVAKALRRLLRREYEVEIAGSGEEGLVKLESFRPDVVISDFRMPAMNGAEFLAGVRRRSPLTLRVILSGYADLESVLASVNEGEICHFLRKPWNDAELLALLRRMLASRDLLSRLYAPFRAERQGLSTDVRQESSRVLVRARLAGSEFTADEALAVVRRFASAIEESQMGVVGGLLERHGGTLSFVAQVGGEQALTLELPLSAELPADAS